MRTLRWIVFALVTSPHWAWAQYGAEVISYEPGTTATVGYDSVAAALGRPARTNGGNLFEGVVSPFNPPYKATDLVSVGELGQITLRLSHYAVPQAGAPEIGVFTHVGLADFDYPNGQSDGTPFTFGVDGAYVDVSADGVSWISLGGMTFDRPTSAYTDLISPFSLTDGAALADAQQPFIGHLADFAGKSYAGASPNILELLGGSAGGTWIDISATGLAQVGFIRFSLPEFPSIDESFELDAVSVSHAALGAPTVPEPAAVTLVVLSLAALAKRRRRTTRGAG